MVWFALSLLPPSLLLSFLLLASSLLSSLGLKVVYSHSVSQSHTASQASASISVNRRGDAVFGVFSHLKTSFWCLFDPGCWNSNCYHLRNKMTSTANSLAAQIQRREQRVVGIQGHEKKKKTVHATGFRDLGLKILLIDFDSVMRRFMVVLKKCLTYTSLLVCVCVCVHLWC